MLNKTIHKLETLMDNTRQAIRARVGYFRPIRVEPYIGHASRDTVWVRGRALSNLAVETKPGQSAAHNALHMLRRYESDEVRGAQLTLEFQGERREVTTDAEGYYDVEWTLSSPIEDGPLWRDLNIELHAPLGRSEHQKQRFSGHVQTPMSPRFGIISDIDDTIIHTGANDLLRHARTVLMNNAHTRQPFEGVAELYQALQREDGRPTNPIFYLSSSPWNLHDLFRETFELNDLPRGSFFLRDFGISPSALFKASHDEHKGGHIRRLFRQYPDLPFILIGDSGQHDLQIYRSVLEEFPERILAVYIRDVTEGALSDEIDTLATRAQGISTSPVVLTDDTAVIKRSAQALGLI